MQKLLIATSNPGKLREVTAIIAKMPVELVTLRNCPDVPPAIEDGHTFEENARRKAVHYARYTGLWTLADDSGLEVDALASAPGVYSARYAGENATDAANNAKLIAQLTHIAAERRTARFVCVVALAKPTPGCPAVVTKRVSADVTRSATQHAEAVTPFHPPSQFAAAHPGQQEAEVLATATGVLEGVIIDDPRGSNGFGYDPHFFVPPLKMTSAQMPPELKNAVSHRAKALQEIGPQLERLLSSASKPTC